MHVEIDIMELAKREVDVMKSLINHKGTAVVLMPKFPTWNSPGTWRY